MESDNYILQQPGFPLIWTALVEKSGEGMRHFVHTRKKMLYRYPASFANCPTFVGCAPQMRKRTF